MRQSTLPLMVRILLAAVLLALWPGQSWAADFVEPVKPAKNRVSGVTVGAVVQTDPVLVPLITWGGDAVTLLANGGTDTVPASPFGKAGLNMRLAKQDDFVAQVRDYMEGKTPFLRGTMGMVNAYSEVLNSDPRTVPVTVLQLTWSTGGDCLVVRPTIQKPSDLKGKTIVIQQYGPHVEYMDQVLTDAGLSWSDVTIKWCEELFDTNGKADDPPGIFREDPKVDAAFCISPDAAALTSNMAIGTGAEGSVKGARVLLSTKTASRVIADVYAVRKDFLEAKRDWVEKFVRTHLESQQKAVELLKKPDSAEAQSLLKMTADKLLDNPEAIADAQGLLADCTFAFGGGNNEFFKNKGNLVGFEPTVKRNQAWLVTQGYVTRAQSLAQADWDYSKFGVAGAAAAPQVAFKKEEAQRAAASAAEGSILFEFEINFEPNQKEFNEARYGGQFQRALELASTYSGAILEIVGHSDHYEYLRLKIKEKATEEVLMRQWQAGMNLSLGRANSVRDALIAYGRNKGLTLNESQFITTGKGYESPKVERPMSADDLAKNRRVQFRVINIEAESESVFEPLF
ncbi:ABC transporter substrate-binding protein [Candidatus Poribacteria bacterium]|nr:ABC transporter substrate-binding protein [Candidatus Poribacteria bacterium]